MGEAQHVEAAEEIGDRPPLQRLGLAGEEQVPDRMLRGREPLPILRDRPIVRAAFDDGFGEHLFLHKEKPRPEVRTGCDPEIWLLSARQIGPARASR